MKTQIIQLDPNDDYVSISDKITWSQTRHILLVWPNEGHPLNQRLELTLVKRQADRLGAQLALVTHDPEACFTARQIGIPVFDDLYRAQETPWPVIQKENNRLISKVPHSNWSRFYFRRANRRVGIEHPAKRILSLLMSFLALSALMVVILPGATIRMAPKTDTQSITLTILADPSLNEINRVTDSLPTYTLDLTVEGSDSQATTGSVTIPSATSGGMDMSVPSPSQEDLRQLRQHLSDQLEQASLAKLQTLVPNEDILIKPSVKVVEIVEETLAPAVGAPGNKLNLTMRVRFQSRVVSGEVLRNFVTPTLDNGLPDGYTPIRGTMVFDQLSIPVLDENGTASLTIRAQRTIAVNINTNEAINLVKGLPISAAIEQLSITQPLTMPAQISLFPSWWPRLPFLDMRIQVVQSEPR